MLLKNPASVLILVCGVILTVFASENNKMSELYRRRRQTSIIQDTGNVGCQLPPPQQNGRSSPSKRRCPPDNDHPLCKMTPGDRVPQDWVLFHKCDPGYILNNTATTVSVCLNGHWKPVLPRCVKLCPALPSSLSVKTKCLFRGREVSCDKEMRPGTVTSAECPQFYKSSFKKSCSDNGTWMMQNQTLQLVDSNAEEENQSSFRCIPECGKSSKTNKTSENPTPTESGEFPWVAGIYRKYVGKWRLFCSGTLISTHVVVTSANCFYDSTKIEAGDIRVVLGILGQNFYKSENSAVIFEVESVKVHSLYNGTHFGYNIVLLSLLVEVHVSSSIMPVCIDWGLNNTMASGTLLKLAGWTSGNYTMITTSQLISISNEDCYNHLRPGSKLIIPEDKFCGGNTNGSIYDDDFSIGTGLTFEKEGRHFLTGFISGSINRVILITDIWKHYSWLKNMTYLL